MTRKKGNNGKRIKHFQNPHLEGHIPGEIKVLKDKASIY